MKLECYPTVQRPPDIVPGRHQRGWMERFTERHAYRCLPLTMANVTGWELLCPMSFSAEWNGGKHSSDITLRSDQPHPDFEIFAQSHFAHGVLTLHPGYLFRSEPGWSMWVMGPPNHVKDGIQPLAGLVETDWLPFPWTMNWHFTRPGKIRFEKGEPFCFITLAQDKVMEEVDLVQKPLDRDNELMSQYNAWNKQRGEFNKKIFKGDAEAMKEAWQRFYFRGELPDDLGSAPEGHVNKRRLKPLRLG